MFYVWLKVILLCLCSLAFHKGFTAPNPSPSDKSTVYKGQTFEHVVRSLAPLADVTIAWNTLSKSIVLLGVEYPAVAPLAEQICPIATANIHSLKAPSAKFFTGVLFILIGSIVRLWCYKTLGTLFTFEVGMEKNHTLVTSGPYSYMRHPSYTAIFFMLGGAHLLIIGSGSYGKECGLMDTWFGWTIILWFSLVLYSLISLYKRGTVEDKQLHDRFGDSWLQYRANVPYMFFPFVL